MNNILKLLGIALGIVFILSIVVVFTVPSVKQSLFGSSEEKSQKTENNDSNNNQKEPANADNTTEVRKSNFKKFGNQTSASSEIKPQEVRESNLSKFENQTLASSENEPQEVRKANANYTDTNYTDLNYTNPIYPSREFSTRSSQDGYDEMDTTTAYMEIIKENIEYEHHMQHDEWNNKAMFQELYDVICEVVCVPRKTIKVAGEDYPYELVKSKFLKLNSSHLDYVTGCMKDTTTKINNIKVIRSNDNSNKSCNPIRKESPLQGREPQVHSW